MSARTDALAAEFETVNGQLIDTIGTLSEEQWHKRCESEGWSVGVTAHHVAGGLNPIAGLVQLIATSQPLPHLTPEIIDQGNARHAQESANCTKEETVEMLRSGGVAAAAMVRGLSDEQLANSAPVFGNTMSAEQAIENILIGHPRHHLESIQKAV